MSARVSAEQVGEEDHDGEVERIPDWKEVAQVQTISRKCEDYLPLIENTIDWKQIELLRDKLPFEIDGIVIKVNSLRDQDILGATGRNTIGIRCAIAAQV